MENKPLKICTNCKTIYYNNDVMYKKKYNVKSDFSHPWWACTICVIPERDNLPNLSKHGKLLFGDSDDF